jgi:hypothetical protein
VRLDDRDGDLAEALDALVRDVQPRDEGAGSVRARGNRRRATRWTAIGVAVIVFAGGVPVAGLLLRNHPRHAIQGRTQWSTYLFKVTKGQGYLIRHPSTWPVQSMDAACGGWSGPTVFFSNVRFHFKALSAENLCGDQWDFRGLPARAVAIDLDPMVVGPAPPPGFSRPPPTRFPISLNEHSPAPAPTPAGGPIGFRTWEIPIYVKGVPGYRVRVFIGPEASASDRDFAREIVASIAPLEGTESHPDHASPGSVLQAEQVIAEGDVVLDPPPPGTRPKISPEQAFRMAHLSGPAGTAMLVLLTTPHEQADSGQGLAHDHQLAWDFRSWGCYEGPVPPAASPLPSCMPSETDAFVDANTGSFLEAISS